MPKLSIIVVSYNTREMTLACVRSVFRETLDCLFEVIVVDNASSDGSVEALIDEFGGRIVLMPMTSNLGFAAGNNRATAQATGEFLLLLNPDTVVLDRAIDRLMAFADNHAGAGIWGGRTLFADGTLNPSSCWSRQSLWSLLSQAIGASSLFRHSCFFNPEGMGCWDRQGERSVDIVSGCFLLIRRELWEHLGGFREMFYMYGEEADLCLRARHLGIQPVVTSLATIVHHGGASETVRADKLVRLLKAKMLLIHEHFPRGTRHIGFMLLALWPWSRGLAFRVLSLFRPATLPKYRLWHEVFNRRREWYEA
jgi:GT2 family glycosyltransferase